MTAIPHPAGLFSGRMMARLALADWANAPAVPKPSRAPLVAMLIASNMMLLSLVLVLWLLHPFTSAPLPAFPPPLTPLPAGPVPQPAAAPLIEAPAKPAALATPEPPRVAATVATTPAPAPTPAPLADIAAVLPAALPAAPVATPNGSEEPPHTTAITVMTTGYCPCAVCCGANAEGITSTNRDVRHHPRGIAVDPTLIPYRTTLTVPGYGTALVDDTGAAMRNDGARGIVHLDLRFRSHAEARAWGVRWIQIAVPDAAPAAQMSATPHELTADQSVAAADPVR